LDDLDFSGQVGEADGFTLECPDFAGYSFSAGFSSVPLFPSAFKLNCHTGFQT
jgi:hypothetical protein